MDSSRPSFIIQLLLSVRKIHLTTLEIKIVKLICKEFTAKEIAAKLGMSYRTIEGYRLIIEKKIGVKSLVGIVLFAVKSGIIQIDG
jgi:DNA-binding CsgD family transcriptional regulator